MYTAIQSAIAVDFTLYKIKLLLLLLDADQNNVKVKEPRLSRLRVIRMIFRIF